MLKFIGTGSAFNTSLGNNSCFYKKGSSMLLIDCGSNVFSRMIGANLLQDLERIFVLVTHLHPDHVGSLGDLIFYCYYIAHIDITVLTPDAVNLKQLLTYMGVKSELYGLVNLENKYEISHKDMKVMLEPYKAAHSENMNSYGYLLDMEGTKTFYSGDCREIREEIFEMLQSGSLDNLYQDTCSYDYPGNVHMSLQRLCRAIKKEFRSKVFCMHLDENFDAAAASEQGFNVAKNYYE